MTDSLWSLDVSWKWKEIKRNVTVATTEAVGRRNKYYRNRGINACNKERK